MTVAELNLLGIANVRQSSNNYFLMTPAQMSTNYVQMHSISLTGSWISDNANGTYSIRPAISLVADMMYSSGDGSTANPYVVDLNSLNN